MDKKTILMTTSYYPPYHVGGACVHVYQLANALAELGHEVHVIYSLDWYYFKKGKIEPTQDYPNNKNVILHPVSSPLRSITPFLAYTFGNYYPLSEEILQTIKNVEPDVIHHHNITGFGPFILKAKAEKVLYTAHDYWLICPTRTLLKNNKIPCNESHNCSICSIVSKKPPTIWRYFSKNMATDNIDTIISPSNYMKNDLVRFGISNKIEVIPNFIDANTIEKRRYFENPYFLFIGRLEDYKGIIYLIESYLEIVKTTENHLVIVGDGNLGDKIKSIASSKKSLEKIHYLGQVDNSTLSNLYQFASAVVIPSIWPENCPLVALEAISYGTPIIAANTGGLSEIVNISKAGVLVDLKDINSFAKIVDKIVNDKIFLNKLRNNAIKNSNLYSKDNFLQKYFDLLQHT